MKLYNFVFFTIEHLTVINPMKESSKRQHTGGGGRTPALPGATAQPGDWGGFF